MIPDCSFENEENVMSKLYAFPAKVSPRDTGSSEIQKLALHKLTKAPAEVEAYILLKEAGSETNRACTFQEWLVFKGEHLDCSGIDFVPLVEQFRFEELEFLGYENFFVNKKSRAKDYEQNIRKLMLDPPSSVEFIHQKGFLSERRGWRYIISLWRRRQTPHTRSVVNLDDYRK